MRLPKITNFDPNVDEVHIHLEEVPKFKYDNDMTDEKLIQYIERIVRNSEEYRTYVQFLKNEMDLNHCVFLFNVDMNMVSIEIHHSFFTLFDIVAIVLQKHRTTKNKVSPFEVAEEVVLLHYMNQIALAPVTKTIHDLLHTGDLFLPLQLMYGNWKQFYADYKQYMTPQLIERAKDYINLSNEIIEDFKMPIIDRKFSYIQIDGVSLPKKIKKEKEDVI